MAPPVNPFPNSNQKFTLSSKYHGLEDNIWLTIAPSPTEKVVNLGQGFPDYNPAPEIVRHLESVCHPEAHYLNHQYARAFGHVRLVKALGALYGHLLDREINPMDEVLVTGGAYGALFYAIMSNVGPGDEVIIIEPAFDCYETMVKLAGGTPVYIPLLPVSQEGTSASWKLDMTHLRSLFNSKTKGIILNSPNNPLGKVFTEEELLEIGHLCQEFNALIISDEVYEWIVYDSNAHERIAGLEDFWNRTITIGSAGKTFSLTGWKLGWCYGPAHLIWNVRVAHQNCTYMCQTPEQEALAITFEKELPLLGTEESYFTKMCTTLHSKRERMMKSLRASGFAPIVPEGGYFVMVNWRALAPKIDLSSEIDGEEDFKFVRWLYREKKLVGIPPSAFYSQEHKALAKDYIRFNFYKKEETLDEADKILASFK